MLRVKFQACRFNQLDFVLSPRDAQSLHRNVHKKYIHTLRITEQVRRTIKNVQLLGTASRKMARIE